MPTAPGRACRWPGCPRVSRHRSGYCEVHRLQFAGPGPRQQGYDSAWEDVRATVLREEPFCRFCLAAGKHVAASQVDHIKPLSMGGARLERSNLRPLCASCHSRRTATDSLGWGKRRT